VTTLHPYTWQNRHWSQLLEVVNDDRLPHAMLFSGPEGIGKRRFVSAFAALNLCKGVTREVGHACGECRACIFLSANSHPDLLWIAPEDNSRAIKVDQIRALTDFVYKTSQLGGNKVAVIEPAESMNLNAANALLKVLEEPSRDTFLLLVSDAPARLLATIRSRCLQIGFPVPDESFSLDWLGGITGSKEVANDLLRLSSGRPLAALALHEGNALAMRVALADSWLDLWTRKRTAMSIAASLGEFEIEEVLAWVNLWLQDIVRWQSGAREQVLADSATCLRLVQSGNDTSVPIITDVIAMLDLIADFRRQLARGANPNKQLLLERLATSFVSKHRHQF